jgi:hypothetical protein
MMNWKGCERNDHGLMEVLFRYLPGVAVENHQDSLDSWCTGQDSNRALPKCKSAALPLHQPAHLHDIITQMTITLILKAMKPHISYAGNRSLDTRRCKNNVTPGFCFCGQVLTSGT